MTAPARIRNFSIIAHIDHGKSTLADRLLEATGTISAREMQAQVMDSMELERERGITIKAKAVRMRYRAEDGQDYILNLIDTPGHVDFSYEVSRALAACEGALLVVDATQGVEAQTLANATLAQALSLRLVPIINKVDLPAADVEGVTEQIFDVLKIDSDPLAISAKQGLGTAEVLEAIVRDVPPPQGDPEAPLAALIFDSNFSVYRGVILLVRVVDGGMAAGMKLRFFSTGHEIVVEEVGHLIPKMAAGERLSAGEVGYVICGIKDIHQVRVGDTLMEAARPRTEPLPGYKEAKPVVFAGIFPVNPADYPDLAAALEKLNLEDSSFNYQPESSQALGFGFRLGFLGLLHMDIVKERLEREFDLSLIVTSPNVVYRVKTRKGEDLVIDNPAKFPPHGDIQSIEEPFVLVTIVLPVEHQEGVLNLLKERRGEYVGIEYIAANRMLIRYRLPLCEMVVNFYDRLKSVSKGYASLDYADAGNRASDMVRMEILIHGEPVDALSSVVHRDKAYDVGRLMCAKLKELIHRQNFEVAIQARIDSRIIARETLSAKRKDVLAKCYGGDITRKRKLLSKQKEGKKRAKQFGAVELPQEAFLAVLRLDEDKK
ncbi:MAG TPA: elongation factor 4 [Elusimicrobia bacterium]|nr:elongation factor 4 [Elusimicrobiota bacterium]HBT61865.1 elongation factor 4 [Elusimicrobiota bacterium]